MTGVLGVLFSRVSELLRTVTKKFKKYKKDIDFDYMKCYHISCSRDFLYY